MPRPALTDEQRRNIRRNIREAAAQLYADNGVNNVSVRAVAQQAGVSVGTVYSHFGSLSELLQSLWRRPARKLVQQMMQLADDEQGNPLDRLRRLLKAYIRFSEDEPQVFRSAFLFVRPHYLQPPEQIPLANDQFFRLFRDAIVSGQEKGMFRSGDPNVLVQLMLGAVHGALALPINLHRLALRDDVGMAELAMEAQLEWLQAGA